MYVCEYAWWYVYAMRVLPISTSGIEQKGKANAKKKIVFLLLLSLLLFLPTLFVHPLNRFVFVSSWSGERQAVLINTKSREEYNTPGKSNQKKEEKKKIKRSPLHVLCKWFNDLEFVWVLARVCVCVCVEKVQQNPPIPFLYFGVIESFILPSEWSKLYRLDSLSNMVHPFACHTLLSMLKWDLRRRVLKCYFDFPSSFFPTLCDSM